MSYKTDIEIARGAEKKPIQEVGAHLGIPAEHLLPFGHDKAKVSQEFIDSVQDRNCLLYTSPSPRDKTVSRMPSSA